MQIFRLDHGREDGISVWDVMLDNGMAVYINAQTGDIIAFEPWRNRWSEEQHNPWRAYGIDTGSTPASATSPAVAGGITRDRAIQIALAQFPGTTVIKITTGTEYGVPVWDVELSNGMTLDIARVTGAIIEIWGNGQNRENDNYDDYWHDNDDWNDDDWDD